MSRCARARRAGAALCLAALAVAGCGDSGAPDRTGAGKAASGEPLRVRGAGETPTEGARRLVAENFAPELAVWRRLAGTGAMGERWSTERLGARRWRVTLERTSDPRSAAWDVLLPLEGTISRREAARLDPDKGIVPVDTGARRLSRLPPLPYRSGDSIRLVALVEAAQLDRGTLQLSFPGADALPVPEILVRRGLDRPLLRGVTFLRHSTPPVMHRQKIAERFVIRRERAGGRVGSNLGIRGLQRLIDRQGPQLVLFEWPGIEGRAPAPWNRVVARALVLDATLRG